ADDHARVVDSAGYVAHPPRRADQTIEVLHLSSAVQKCSFAAGTDDLRAGGVERQRGAVVAAERAEVFHRPAAPEEGVRLAVARKVRLSDDLASVVDRVAHAPVAAERAESGHRPVFPEEGEE